MATNDNLPTTFILENVHEYSSVNPRDLTHIAIGSSPRYGDMTKFIPEIDQLLPQFMLKEIKTTTKTIRIIHIDEFTERSLPFLHEYFASFSAKNLNFTHDNSEGMNIWTTDDQRIEIIFLFIQLNHGLRVHSNPDAQNDSWFIEKMIETTLDNKNQLIVQEYTGHELTDLFKMLYRANGRKELFKNNILFDVTYGNDCSCMTNMTIHFPRYKPDGTFYNFLLYNDKEMHEFVGIDDKINDILKVYFLKKYNHDLDFYHVNYRRKMIGTSSMYNFPNYDSLSADEIMKMLIEKLKPSITIFELLGFIDHGKSVEINDLFNDYKNYDMYEWRTSMMNIFK
jgi:hypothetical protein